MPKIFIPQNVRDAFQPEMKLVKKERVKTDRDKTCKTCGSPFHDESFYATRRYCSTACKPKPKNRCSCGRHTELKDLDGNASCSFCQKTERTIIASQKAEKKTIHGTWERCVKCGRCKPHIISGVCTDCHDNSKCSQCGVETQLNYLGYCATCMVKINQKINGTA